MIGFALRFPPVLEKEELNAGSAVIQDSLSDTPTAHDRAEHGGAEQPELTELRPRGAL